MDFFVSAIVGIAVILAWMLYKKLSGNFLLFKERGIPFVKPVVIFGNSFGILTKKENFIDCLQRFYNKFYDEKVFGFFNFRNVHFVVKDVELIKDITIKNFDHFVNHDRTFDEHCDKIVGRSLSVLQGEKWRIMRNTLSPMFTSSKMKMMFGMVSECAQDFIQHFNRKPGSGKIIVDAGDMFARYTVDGISTAALGFKGDSIQNEESSFFKMARSITAPTLAGNLKFFLLFIAKPIYIFLGLQFISSELRNFLHASIIDVIRERETKSISRPDIIQLLIQSKSGKLEGREQNDGKDLKNFSANIEYDVGGKTRNKMNWTDEDMMAQGFIFLTAGFDTVKNLLQMTSYELAKNRDVQQELIEEVDGVLATSDGSPIAYEALHQMKFLDQVISESLRFWPPAVMTDRVCNKDYVMNLGHGKTLTIKVDDNVLIPISAIHHDEKYFDNPNTFDPHRFDDDRKDSILPGSFIPFGYGPRACIASRLALMETKLLVFYILSKFSIEVCDKTPKNLELMSFFGEVELKEKIFVEFKPRK